jgi:hypothetical protein
LATSRYVSSISGFGFSLGNPQVRYSSIGLLWAIRKRIPKWCYSLASVLAFTISSLGNELGLQVLCSSISGFSFSLCNPQVQYSSVGLFWAIGKRFQNGAIPSFGFSLCYSRLGFLASVSASTINRFGISFGNQQVP